MVKMKKTKTTKKLKPAAAVTTSAKGKGAIARKKVQTKSTAKPLKKKLPSSTPKKLSTLRKSPKNSSATGVRVKIVKKQNNKNLSPREEKLQMIRTKLLRQRETLLNEAESALNELPGQTIFPDLGDQASAETDRNFMLRLRGREQRLLKKIDEAISRIENGTFGICDDCGNEIDIKRLEARPVTTMCIECKTLQEEEEKLRES
jgi:DnaK suppressor protein